MKIIDPDNFYLKIWMENKTFNFYRLRFMELEEKAKEALLSVGDAPDPLSLIRAKQQLTLYTTQAKIIKGKMEAYGAGVIIKVSGDYFKPMGDPEDPTGYQRLSFEMYLNCNTIEDARDIFLSQVSEKYKFDLESVKFNTIQLKSLFIT